MAKKTVKCPHKGLLGAQGAGRCHPPVGCVTRWIPSLPCSQPSVAPVPLTSHSGMETPPSPQGPAGLLLPPLQPPVPPPTVPSAPSARPCSPSLTLQEAKPLPPQGLCTCCLLSRFPSRLSLLPLRSLPWCHLPREACAHCPCCALRHPLPSFIFLQSPIAPDLTTYIDLVTVTKLSLMRAGVWAVFCCALGRCSINVKMTNA